ncbi:MAG: chemotaxis protein CheD [Pseudomonadota bacterium]
MSAPAASGPNERVHHVVQGEYAILDDANVVLSTILGSCVATCLYDPLARVGGMNHFLLPGEGAASGESMKYGVNAMELLINGMLQRGATRNRLEAKLFGGAHVIDNLNDIGAQNAAFAERFLRMESIRVIASSLGGVSARRVRFWPATGRASQLLLERADVFREERRVPAPKPAAQAGSVELF